MNGPARSYGPVILEASDVSLTLGGKLILRDVNLSIKDVRRTGQTTGQVVALLGPSGIGKTRLFRILAGLDAPDKGTVLVGEGRVPVAPGMVGVVAQNYALFRHRTVLGNLVVAGTHCGLSSDEAHSRGLKYLRQFGLEETANRYPAQLSGGQKQRVAIAQQFMCSQHFLLMDEPFSGLDPLAVDRVCGLITEVAHADELNTIIVVTHDIGAALEVADTLWLLGRERAADGSVLPGARIMESYDLLERGLAWREDISSTPEFADVLREIRKRFQTL